MKKILIGILAFSTAIVVVVIVAAWLVGTAVWYEPPAVQQPVSIAREFLSAKANDTGEHRSQILFGDLHVHTSYSLDAAIFDTPVAKGSPRTTPADACDYARYCSALDFWSINDHAEGLTPSQWDETRQAIRQCNAVTDPKSPDTVAFLGWEWTQGSDSPNQHYGHKNVIFLDQEEGRVPTRAIGSAGDSVWRKIANTPAVLRGLGLLAGSRLQPSEYQALAHHMQSLHAVADCGEGDVRSLDPNCYESAETPEQLFNKLDQWGFEAQVIPHGLSWSTTNPLGADFKYQMDQLNDKYQRLLEVYSGHGSSEIFRDLPSVVPGDTICPEPIAGFTACCWQAGNIIFQRCSANGGDDCESRADATREQYLQAMSGGTALSLHRTVVRDTVPDDWGQCDQLTNSFQPAHNYQARQSAQYILALVENGQQFRPGFIGSSDNHSARPGNSYKELSRYVITDTKASPRPVEQSDQTQDRPQPPLKFGFEDEEDAANGFYYSGGLVAVHSDGRSREAIWQALKQKSVYGTSGPRIQLWFDLHDTDNVRHSMGSEVKLSADAFSEAALFSVKAIGSLRQNPGCPDAVTQALGAARTKSLCRSECQNPGDTLNRIERIEVVRIRPRQSVTETIKDLIQDPWRSFDCKNQTSCEVEFTDPEFAGEQGEVAYYVRAIQEPTDTIQGDPFHCEYDSRGQCVKTNYCLGVPLDNDCLSPSSHRAWSSPIYVMHSQ